MWLDTLISCCVVVVAVALCVLLIFGGALWWNTHSITRKCPKYYEPKIVGEIKLDEAKHYYEYDNTTIECWYER